MKNYLDGGEAILEAFRKLKVDYIMSSPGSEWSPVWEALARQKLDNNARARPSSNPGTRRSPSTWRAATR